MGIVLGVLVLFIVGSVLLLIFAKSNEMWCFTNEDYQYRDPQDKRRPVSHAQVYRFYNERTPLTNNNKYLLSDDPSPKPRPSKSHNSNRSSGSSTERKIHPDDRILTNRDDQSANNKQSTDPKIINYELQVIAILYINLLALLLCQGLIYSNKSHTKLQAASRTQLNICDLVNIYSIYCASIFIRR